MALAKGLFIEQQISAKYRTHECRTAFEQATWLNLSIIYDSRGFFALEFQWIIILCLSCLMVCPVRLLVSKWSAPNTCRFIAEIRPKQKQKSFSFSTLFNIWSIESNLTTFDGFRFSQSLKIDIINQNICELLGENYYRHDCITASIALAMSDSNQNHLYRTDGNDLELPTVDDKCAKSKCYLTQTPSNGSRNDIFLTKHRFPSLIFRRTDGFGSIDWQNEK